MHPFGSNILAFVLITGVMVYLPNIFGYPVTTFHRIKRSMKILILGGGLMGPAAAFNALSNPDVSQVIICDMSQEQLQHSVDKLAGKPGAEKLGVVRLDLTNQEAATQLMAKFDAIVAALPKSMSAIAIETALKSGTPLIDLTMPENNTLPRLREIAQSAGGLAILACGLEPGLTEIMARHLAEKLDQVR